MTQVLTTFDRDRTALVFIEFQAEWIGDGGVLFERLVEDKAAFRAAVARAAEVLEAARRAGWTIVHAGLDLRDDPGYRLFAEGKGVLGLRAGIPKAGTWTGAGAEPVAPFIPRPGEFIPQGRSGASVLKHSNLDGFLRNNRIDTVLLMGFATHVCVESTLREAHDLGLNAWVVEDGCAAFTEAQHEHVLREVVHHFGGRIASADLIGHMQRGA
ncbi:MAG TPA: cysteine hydrolase [Geothrix sp.]|nr:cysteine hydrolase [Geothrix sp.]